MLKISLKLFVKLYSSILHITYNIIDFQNAAYGLGSQSYSTN